ncbi:sigma factor-like helix-turn-helix DNA-binding protein [Streptomyces coelicoflavus]|uniref:sigma factor-like helix-turn-helix DNA-binding protein n=1 Tax=Streptomyces coelicoflavus TaxID=285562 RepID=UPI0037FA1EEA
MLDLVAVDGLTPREAAQTLGLNRATVRTRLHRARRPLRTQPPTPTTHTHPHHPHPRCTDSSPGSWSRWSRRRPPSRWWSYRR